MVGYGDPFPCCGHKRRLPALERWHSSPASVSAAAARSPRPAKFARSISSPSPSAAALAIATPAPLAPLAPALTLPTLQPQRRPRTSSEHRRCRCPRFFPRSGVSDHRDPRASIGRFDSDGSTGNQSKSRSSAGKEFGSGGAPTTFSVGAGVGGSKGVRAGASGARVAMAKAVMEGYGEEMERANFAGRKDQAATAAKKLARDEYQCFKAGSHRLWPQQGQGSLYPTISL